MSTGCRPCAKFEGVSTVLCGEGRTTVYGATREECLAFGAAALEFEARISDWTRSGNGTSFPGCRDALEVLFCSQQEVYDTLSEADDDLSQCTSYRRPDHASVQRCLQFCPAIRDSCPTAAHDHCQARCRDSHETDFCRVIEVSGLSRGRYPEDTLDLLNIYRLETEGETPLLRDGRPAYRSIPARRASLIGGRATKLDYYLYSTHVRGFEEWLLDTNDLDTDGAVAHASDSNIAPYKINSDWSVWSPGVGWGSETGSWIGEPLYIQCRVEEHTSGATRDGRTRPTSQWTGAWLPLATAAAVLTAPWGTAWGWSTTPLTHRLRTPPRAWQQGSSGAGVSPHA